MEGAFKIDDILLNIQGNNTIAYTVTYNDIPIVIGGLCPVCPGLMQTWLSVSENIQGHGLAITKLLKYTLYSAINAYNIYSLIAYVSGDNPEYVKWAMLFGFRPITIHPIKIGLNSEIVIMNLTLGA